MLILRNADSTTPSTSERRGLLLYLVATSRTLKQPTGIIISGPSSSGKSTIPAVVAEMMPPEEVIHATSMTPNALYYGEPGWLAHKILMFGELSHRSDDEQADKTAALRQLISEGRINKVLTDKINGKFTTQRIEQDGPVAFCATTTLNREKIFAEDVNRLLFVRTNDTEAQTKNVMLATASRYMSETPTVDRQAILDRHREFQRSLKQCDMKIPFADKLAQAMPATRIEARRVIQQVLSTIEAVAVLHQHQRERDKVGRLVATRTDYEIARKLLLQPLNKSIGLSDREQSAYAILREKFPIEFDSDQALKAGSFNNKMTRDRTLKELKGLGVIKQTAAGKSHQSARWAWTGKSLDELILPSAKSVFVTTQQVTQKRLVTK